MKLEELAKDVVRRCAAGDLDGVIDRYYDSGIVSIEAQGDEKMPGRLEGLDAVREKNAWWTAHHEVHALRADGPFIGHRPDQFAVRFELDVTPQGGERMQMREVALYTVRDGRIVQEEFLYEVD